MNLRSRTVRILGPLGLYRAAAFASRRHPRILMYHRFSERARPGFVSAAGFETQVVEIARRYRPTTVGCIAEALCSGASLPRNAVAITVDDGHEDFLRVAWPILRRHGVPATLFATTAFVDGREWLWTDRLTWIVRHAPAAHETLEVGGVAFPAEPERLLAGAMRHTMRLAPDAREAFLGTLADALGVAPPCSAPPEYAPVTWEGLRRAQAEGLEVGGHTHRHPVLSTLSPEALDAELRTCRRRLDEELGAGTRPFCYPNGMPGDYDERSARAVRDAGFSAAVVAHPRPGPHRQRWQLGRHAAAEDAFQFRKAVSGLEWLGLGSIPSP